MTTDPPPPYTCHKCGKDYPHDLYNFVPTSRHPGLPGTVCRACHNARMLERYYRVSCPTRRNRTRKEAHNA